MNMRAKTKANAIVGKLFRKLTTNPKRFISTQIRNIPKNDAK